MTPLRQRMTEDMQLRNLSPDTQRSYLHQISQLARYFKKSPDRLGPPEIRTYQLHLSQDRQLSRSTGNSWTGWRDKWRPRNRQGWRG